MARVYNFSAGPAILPEEVLKKAAGEMTDYENSGMSVMEMSHRSAIFQGIIDSAESQLRKLMSIPDNYKVLFLQGGASSQFSMIPMNLMTKNNKADFINTGQWSKKAISEAKRYGEVNIVASSDETNFDRIPELSEMKFSQDADYVHLVTNNTIYGTRFIDHPDTGDIPLISDMSSCILSEKVDVSKFAMIFAGAQKNIGPAGLTIVIIRDDLVNDVMDKTPTMFKYSTHIESGSMYNTPPTYGIYFAKLVFDWLDNNGGIDAMQKLNEKKASLLYNFIDNSDIFNGTVIPKYRSLMNVPFILPTVELNEQFISEAAKQGLVNLKGYRTVGGMRASIYNAMPYEGVEALVNFMKQFELSNR